MSTLSQHGIKLAVHIITTDFGNLVAKVCECLLRRGTLTKALISRFTDLPPDKVKKSLWVLIQHNCVQAFGLEQEGGSTTLVVTQYMALFNNIIHRLRFPKFMTVVSKEVDKEGLELLEGLLQHGRLTLTQIMDRAVAFSNEGSNASQETCRERFIKLVNSRLVERCPAAEPFISLPTEDKTPAKRGRSKPFKRKVTLEERALRAAIPMDAERFSITDPRENSDEDKSENKFSSAKVGQKRKQGSLQWDSELDVIGGKKEPVWRVNFDEVIHRLRIKACVEYARERYNNNTAATSTSTSLLSQNNNTAAMVLNSMLEGSRLAGTTVSLSLESIFEEVIKTEEGRTMNLERVRASLEQLEFCSEADDVYSVNLQYIIKNAQPEEVESIVSKRYGIAASNIFSTLSKVGPLDTDKISEEAMVDKKDTPLILYKLWKDGYVQMEKVTTGGPRQTDIFIWKVKNDNLWHHVLDELYHAALNLCLRVTYEMEQEREILNMPKAKLAEDEDLKKRHDRVKKAKILLESSLMKLDDAIMLFHDFLF